MINPGHLNWHEHQPPEEPMAAKVPAQTWMLTEKDRCDRCGSRAYVMVLLDAGELLLCGHHYAQYADRLITYPARDEREHLQQDSH